MPLTDAQRAYLNEPRFAVLGILGADNSIWQTVMWYRLEGETIIMNTANGRLKERQLRKNPNVSITVENGYDYITLTGTASIDDDPERGQREIRDIGLRYQSAKENEKMAQTGWNKQHRITIEIPIARVIAHGDLAD
jgi:PPOX class probable F420-dependent enzyme